MGRELGGQRGVGIVTTPPLADAALPIALAKRSANRGIALAGNAGCRQGA